MEESEVVAAFQMSMMMFIVACTFLHRSSMVGQAPSARIDSVSARGSRFPRMPSQNPIRIRRDHEGTADRRAQDKKFRRPQKFES